MTFAVPVWLAVQDALLEDEPTETEKDTKTCFDEFDDAALFEHFHLTRPCISFIVDAVRNRMKTVSYKRPSPPVDVFVMVALNFFAHGAFTPAVVQRIGSCLHASLPNAANSASGVIAGMSDVFISFPFTQDARDQNAAVIKEFCKIPDILGVLAPVQFKIRASPYEKESFKSFINAQGYTSVMSQFICDSQGNILSVEKCCVGSTAEQELWEYSFKGREVEEDQHGNYWLIAGPGYHLGNHILTAVTKPETIEEVLFNEAHAKMLNVMKQTVDLLKRRFMCLLQLGFTEEGSLNKKLNIIKACSVLHNIALKFSVPPPTRAVKTEPLYSGKLLAAETNVNALRARKELIQKNFSKPRNQN
ncbi:hypothetical protein OJAV_G00190010 [Oryzias javanicus]|uniref:DDE Tnp4 domain-containing protein n=1 Tax=Oryzias javanicus TaxID=123683 RepID=A0A437CB36_ORYJA|nr:hypothetical protein OJAV_G00190010 [Oryzias javanicus]